LFTVSERKRCPFTHAISGQDGRAICGCGQERRRRVRLVMFSEQNLTSGDPQSRRDDAPHPDFLAERVPHGLWKRAPGMRKAAQGARENPIEFQHRSFIEDDGVERFRLEAGMFKTPFNRRQRERRVAFVP
jgi:hypothetical protein